MEQAIEKLTEDVKARLSKINWKELESNLGITREQIEKMPTVANDLAYQRMTNLVYGHNDLVSGQFSLRAIPGKNENDPWTVKAYTIEKEKSPKDAIFLYGSPITSQAAKDALFERTSWENNEGKRVVGRANANAGRPVAIEREVDGQKKKEYYLISIHEPTNRVVAMPVDAVKAFLQGKDKEGNPRKVEVYGKELNDKQVESLCNGKAVLLNGCKTKDGQVFNAAVQFDVARRSIVACHPTALKQAEAIGVDVYGASEKKTEEVKKKPTRSHAKDNKENKEKGAKLNIK